MLETWKQKIGNRVAPTAVAVGPWKPRCMLSSAPASLTP